MYYLKEMHQFSIKIKQFIKNRGYLAYREIKWVAQQKYFAKYNIICRYLLKTANVTVTGNKLLLYTEDL